MSSITIDGLDEEIFRRNIEGMLRVGEADRAAAKLQVLIAPFCGEGRILPARFAEVSSADIILNGWDKLATSLSRNDRPRHPISALTIAVSNAEVLGFDSDDQGPLIATSHFTDEAYPFSNSGLGDLLDGYSFYGCEWHGSSAHVDTALSLGGIDDLYRAIAAVEAELIASARPDPDKIRAGSIGSCYLSVLVYQAVRDAVRTAGVPRAICVMAGNEGIYPYFDAPVIGSMECVEQGLVAGSTADAPANVEAVAPLADAEEVEEQVAATPAGAFGSLAGLVSRKGEKKPVLQLAESDAQSAAEMFERAGEDWMRGTGGTPLPPAPPSEAVSDAWDHAVVAEGDIFADPASFRELPLPDMPPEPEAGQEELLPTNIGLADVGPSDIGRSDIELADIGQVPVSAAVQAVDRPEAVAVQPTMGDVEWPQPAEEPAFSLRQELEVEAAVSPAWAPEVVSPASHSIRNRISAPEPEPEPAPLSLWTRFVGWLTGRYPR